MILFLLHEINVSIGNIGTITILFYGTKLYVALHMYISKEARMDVRSFLGKKYKYSDNILRASNVKGALFKFALKKCHTRQEPLPEVLPASSLLGSPQILMD